MCAPLLPPAVETREDVLSEACKRLGVESESLKLFYLIDTETKEQQNHRMAIAIPDTKLRLK